jgi:hypothetical protein
MFVVGRHRIFDGINGMKRNGEWGKGRGVFDGINMIDRIV